MSRVKDVRVNGVPRYIVEFRKMRRGCCWNINCAIPREYDFVNLCLGKFHRAAMVSVYCNFSPICRTRRLWKCIFHSKAVATINA